MPATRFVPRLASDIGTQPVTVRLWLRIAWILCERVLLQCETHSSGSGACTYRARPFVRHSFLSWLGILLVDGQDVAKIHHNVLSLREPAADGVALHHRAARGCRVGHDTLAARALYGC